jgi:Probable cobalt transporter subunit (CbtB)
MSSTTRPSTIGRLTYLERPAGATIDSVLWLTATTVLALIAYYFVGLDQGAVSVFGSDTHVHEFFHDARHLLGFPCH